MRGAEIRTLAKQRGWLRDPEMETWKFRCPVCQRGNSDPGYTAASVNEQGIVVCLKGCPPKLVAQRAGLAGREQGVALLTVEDILAMPDPSWLVDGVFPDSGLGVLFGPSGVGKSFVTLGVALSVASGVPWLGHRVEQRHVVYIAAEGVDGMKKRLEAWMALHPTADLTRMRFVTSAVNLLDADQVGKVDQALDTLPERPGLIVVDTLARSMVGGDENSARDVGVFIDHADLLARGDLIVVVHHTGHDGEAERGSSALPAAADVRVKVKPSTDPGRSDEFELRCEKLKDWAEWDPLKLELRASAGSCVVAPVDEVAAAGARKERAPKRFEMADRVLDELQLADGPLSQAEVTRRVGKKKGDQTVRRALSALVSAGDIRKDSKGYVLTGVTSGVTPPDTPNTAAGVSRTPSPVGGSGTDTESHAPQTPRNAIFDEEPGA